MISFACKQITLPELIKCSFDLNKTDYSVFEFLMSHDKEYFINDLAKELNMERSSVQKAIKNLAERDLVLRKQVNLDGGGYKFFYIINNKQLIKHRMEEIVDTWHYKVKEAIKKLG